MKGLNERLGTGKGGHFSREKCLGVVVCVLIIAVFSLYVLSVGASPWRAPDATVRLEPSIQTVDLGEHFTVDVMIDDYADLGGYEFNLLSDSSVDQGESAEDGGLLESTGRIMILAEEGYNPLLDMDNDSPTGRVSFAAYTAGDDPGPSGTNAKLSTVQMKAIDLHNMVLDLEGVQIVDTQGTPQSLLPPVDGTVLVNTAVNGKFKEYCVAHQWWRINMDPDETKDPPGPGTVDCRDYEHTKTGPYAFKITGSPTENKYLKQQNYINGEAGETFKLSGWSYVTSDTDLSAYQYRLAIRVTYTDESKETFAVDFSKDPADWNTWQYREVEFTTAKPYRKLEVYARFYQQPATATAWFDDISLERQSDNWEVIVNGSFEEYCVARQWWRINMDPDETKDPPGPGTVDCRDYEHTKTGPYAFKITGSPTENKYLKQQHYINGEAGETFKLSGWSYVTSDTDLSAYQYRLAIRVTYTDESKETFAVDFSKDPADWNTWQYREVEFTTAKPYRKLEIYARFYQQPATATAWFDDMQLVRQLP